MRREKLILQISFLIIVFVFFNSLFGIKTLQKNHNYIIIPEQINNKIIKNKLDTNAPITIKSWTKDIFHNRINVYKNWFRLTGITKFENGYKAIINGEIVGELSRIRGFSVEEITKNQVKLERNDYQVTLNLEE